jgi:DNA-binding NarL/FixJ family response regulator
MPQEGAVFIVDPHSIFRLGMTTCLESLPMIGEVAGADTVAEAWKRPELGRADLVIVDTDVPHAREFVREVREELRTPSLASASRWEVDSILAVVEAGAVGVLAKESLTPQMLDANVRAALHGASVLPAELMARLLGPPESGSEQPAETAAARLTDREQKVLRLIAEGHGTREVAQRLSYSERTIKNVLHDVATKLGARSRSHAVAHAVRAGII